MTVDAGDTAPDFTLPTDGGGSLALADLKGSNVVLYFYPKDMTPGCTTEAQDFRDRAAEFFKANTVIVGASKDSPARHDKFKAKHDLNFALVSDEDGALCEAYGVWRMKKFMGREFLGIVRTTFLIDAEGVIREVWPKVRVKGHAEAVLDAARAL
ncbi:MAG: thioredoxin-dependent thiol peroxidase [Magnetovibrio sp.]|nr:thioredoxin-dependent thiol peroxidase [Magnetovibrio sp.]